MEWTEINDRKEEHRQAQETITQCEAKLSWTDAQLTEEIKATEKFFGPKTPEEYREHLRGCIRRAQMILAN